MLGDVTVIYIFFLFYLLTLNIIWFLAKKKNIFLRFCVCNFDSDCPIQVL